MTIEQALQIIQDNRQSENNSLMDYTHEKSIFNETAFWEFYNAVRVLSYHYRNEETLPRELTTSIVTVYGYFLLQINYHFDSDDGYEMGNLPKLFTFYGSRLRWVVEGFLRNQRLSDEREKYLDMDLPNQLPLRLDD